MANILEGLNVIDPTPYHSFPDNIEALLANESNNLLADNVLLNQWALTNFDFMSPASPIDTSTLIPVPQYNDDDAIFGGSYTPSSSSGLKRSASDQSNSRRASFTGPLDADEKRKRNNEASARFRARRKQKESKSKDEVEDLRVKVASLEQEAELLRRENDWLRELAGMKKKNHEAEKKD